MPHDRVGETAILMIEPVTSAPTPEPPTKDEIARIRKLYAEFQEAPDQLTQTALMFSIPRLLARIDWLQAALTEGSA